MKNELVVKNQQTMMSSLEISDLTDKKHTHIIRDIWVMVEQLYGVKKDDPNMGHYKNQDVALIKGVVVAIDSRGYVSEIKLDRRHTEILISGYDVVRRAAIIDRWHALETGEVKPTVTPPALSKMEILQMALESEAGRIAEKERADQAERTKSQISRSREASALGKLSAVTRKNRELTERLGESVKHATVTAVQNVTGTEYNAYPMRKWCKSQGIEAEYAPCTRFGRVRSWPAEAWLEVHGVDIKKLFGVK